MLRWLLLLACVRLAAQAPNLTKIVASGKPGTTHTAGCKSFEPPPKTVQFICEVESPEHYLVRKYLPHNATVLEFGGRFGTTTCEIASVINNSGRVVVVEPSERVWEILEDNLRRNRCSSTIVKGVVGSEDMKVVGDGYGGRVIPDKSGSAKNSMLMADLEAQTGLKFDTLLVDCEGCMKRMRDQMDPYIVSGQIRRILLEADMPCSHEKSNCMIYEPWFEFLHEHGFHEDVRVNDCWDVHLFDVHSTKWCQSKLNHSVWTRRGHHHHEHHHGGGVELHHHTDVHSANSKEGPW